MDHRNFKIFFKENKPHKKSTDMLQLSSQLAAGLTDPF